jgi:exodeoxyribonuclease VII small subunit
MAARTHKTFEEALERLEEIARDLEQGELGLEEGLKQFEEGMKLVRFCTKKLDRAQQRVELLIEKNGDLTTRKFEASHGDQDLS